MRNLVGASKKDLIKQAYIKWIEPNIYDDVGRAVIEPENEEYMYSVAYNEEGKYQNHMELSKYMRLFQLTTENPNYSLLNLTLPVEYYDCDSESFKTLDDLAKNLESYGEKNIPKNISSILRIGLINSTKDQEETIKDSSLYYSLKKLILEYERVALVGTLNTSDIQIDNNTSRFRWLDNIFILKNSNYLTCPNCGNGILRFDLDNYLGNLEIKEWIAKYKCANSLCGFETDFESLRRHKNFSEWCYTEQDYRKNYSDSRNSFEREDYLNNYIEYEDDD